MPESETPLSNIPSERLILGGIFQHGIDAFIEADSIVQVESFTDEKHRQIYQCLQLCMANDDTIDLPSFYSSASDLGLGQVMENRDYVDYITAVRNTKVKIDNIATHVKIIRRLQFARELQDGARESFKNLNTVTGRESLSAIQCLAEEPIQTLSLQYQKGDESKPKLIGETIRERVMHMMENPNMSRGISTGMPAFDHMIGGGLARQCVDVIVARKKEGKSILADNVAFYIANNGIPTLELDTEMQEGEHQDRLISHLTRIDINEIAHAEYTEDTVKVKKVMDAVTTIEGIPYTYAKVVGKKFVEVLAIIKRWLLQEVGYDENGRLNDCAVIYDYFKLTNTEELSGDLKENQVLGFQMQCLKDFCSEYDFPVLTFVQSNRDGITMEDSRIVASSDRIMDTATSLTIYKSKTTEEINEDGGTRAGNKKFVGVMYRHGPGLENDYVNLRFEGEYATLTELGTRNNMLASGQWETIDDEGEENNRFDGSE